MKTKVLENAKFIIKVESDKNTKQIKTLNACDNRTQENLTDEFIEERGTSNFLNIEDLKETLNWN